MGGEALFLVELELRLGWVGLGWVELSLFSYLISYVRAGQEEGAGHAEPRTPGGPVRPPQAEAAPGRPWTPAHQAQGEHQHPPTAGKTTTFHDGFGVDFGEDYDYHDVDDDLIKCFGDAFFVNARDKTGRPRHSSER